jgi:hypothetical protein
MGYSSRGELEPLGEVLVDLLARLVAGEDGDADVVRARVLEVVTVEEAGRVSAELLEARIAPLVLSAVELAAGRGERGAAAGDAAGEAARRWFEEHPEFVLPLVEAVLELATSRFAGAG